MSYAVKEVFLTLQGEGAHAGRRAVFCRFSGCNLWSGQEADRASAECQFCDTDFVGMDGTRGGRYADAESLAAAIEDEWGAENEARWVVLTGGEPLLQVDEALIEALHRCGFAVAVETNGTIDPPSGLDWLCVSPKAGGELRVRAGHELKLVYPQAGRHRKTSPPCPSSVFRSSRWMDRTWRRISARPSTIALNIQPGG